MSASIKVGDRVYLANCIAGEPGIVRSIARGFAKIEWPDMPEIGRPTFHNLEALVLDEGFASHQSGADFENAAA